MWVEKDRVLVAVGFLAQPLSRFRVLLEGFFVQREEEIGGKSVSDGSSKVGGALRLVR